MSEPSQVLAYGKYFTGRQQISTRQKLKEGDQTSICLHFESYLNTFLASKIRAQIYQIIQMCCFCL